MYLTLAVFKLSNEYGPYYEFSPIPNCAYSFSPQQ